MTWNPQTNGIHVYFYPGGVADITFTNVVSAAGVKAEPTAFGFFNITAKAYDTADVLLGSYTRSINGSAGAAFLGLRATADKGIKRLRVESAAGAGGFAYSDLTWGNPWVSGYLFDDHDHDGVRDAADSLGVPGGTVQLLKGSWVMKTATLAKSGWYDLTGLTPGSYCVRPVLPAGYSPTTPRMVCFDSTSVEARIDFGAGTGSLLRLPWVTR
jgi:hypothetical protein